MISLKREAIAAAVETQLPLAKSLFESLFERTKDAEGVTRPAWSETDQQAVSLLAETAEKLDLKVSYDEIGQAYVTLTGEDRTAPGVLVGSHLDSVPRGGNYDGFAGVVAGMTMLTSLKHLGVVPGVDITVMGTRGEESVWYGTAYIGSRFAVGDLTWSELQHLRRSDTGRSILEHLAECGYEIDTLKLTGGARISPSNTKAYFELHIEQGPVLVEKDLAIAIPTAIRGNVRFPQARCLGKYAHSSAEPIHRRKDAVLATAELVHEFERFWQKQVAAGVPDTQFTVGKLNTNAERDGMTIVPGECRFTFNFGGTTNKFLEVGLMRLKEISSKIAEKRGVRFDLGRQVGSSPVILHSEIRALLKEAADQQAVPYHEMATVGHDAAIFERKGIPSAMILVRNQHGSHNPREAMEMNDFKLGTEVLTRAILEIAA